MFIKCFELKIQQYINNTKNASCFDYFNFKRRRAIIEIAFDLIDASVLSNT